MTSPAERILKVLDFWKDGETEVPLAVALRVAVKGLVEVTERTTFNSLNERAANRALTEIASLLGCEEEKHG